MEVNDNENATPLFIILILMLLNSVTLKIKAVQRALKGFCHHFFLFCNDTMKIVEVTVG